MFESIVSGSTVEELLKKLLVVIQSPVLKLPAPATTLLVDVGEAINMLLDSIPSLLFIITGPNIMVIICTSFLNL